MHMGMFARLAGAHTGRHVQQISCPMTSKVGNWRVLLSLFRHAQQISPPMTPM